MVSYKYGKKVNATMIPYTKIDNKIVFSYLDGMTIIDRADTQKKINGRMLLTVGIKALPMIREYIKSIKR